MTSPNNSHTAVYEAQRNRVSRYISAQSVTKSVYSEFFVELSSLDQLGATFAVFFFSVNMLLSMVKTTSSQTVN